MANETTTSTLTITPQVLIEAVRSGMQGMRVFGRLGIVVVNSSLPVSDRYAGETVTVPYLAHLGAWSEYSENAEIDITVDVGWGRASATVWTCDLTKRYVEINGDYRS